MHVLVPVFLSPSPSVLDICYLSAIYTLCTIRFFSLMIPQPYPIQHSALVHLRQDQITRAFYVVIDWCGLFSYVEQSPTFFHCLSKVLTGLEWIDFDSFFFRFSFSSLFTFVFGVESISCLCRSFLHGDTPREWCYCVLCGYFPLHCMHPKSYTSVGFSFWMLLQYANLFLLIWLRHIIFIFNAKVCIFVVGFWCFDLYLILQFWAVFGVVFVVDFLFISLYDWTEHRPIEMKSDIPRSCCKLGMEALGFMVHAQAGKYQTMMALCGPFRSHIFRSHGFIGAGRYQTKFIQRSN